MESLSYLCKWAWILWYIFDDLDALSSQIKTPKADTSQWHPQEHYHCHKATVFQLLHISHGGHFLFFRRDCTMICFHDYSSGRNLFFYIILFWGLQCREYRNFKRIPQLVTNHQNNASINEVFLLKMLYFFRRLI